MRFLFKFSKKFLKKIIYSKKHFLRIRDFTRKLMFLTSQAIFARSIQQIIYLHIMKRMIYSVGENSNISDHYNFFSDLDDGTIQAQRKLEEFVQKLATTQDSKGKRVLIIATMSTGGQTINKMMLEMTKSTTFQRDDITLDRIR